MGLTSSLMMMALLVLLNLTQIPQTLRVTQVEGRVGIKIATFFWPLKVALLVSLSLTVMGAVMPWVMPWVMPGVSDERHAHPERGAADPRGPEELLR